MNNDLTIIDAVNLSLDMGNFPDVIPVDYGLDLVLKTKPEYIVEANKPRKIRIDITTYRGISCGAIHYYAQINADGVKVIERCKDGNIIHCGYICEEYSQICKNNSGKYEKVAVSLALREVLRKEARK